MSIQVWQKEDRAGSFVTCVHASIHVRVVILPAVLYCVLWISVIVAFSDNNNNQA